MRKLLILFFVLVSGILTAQDLHFSQFYFSHFNVNPAYAGKIKEDFRFFGIHRGQWQNINSQFTSTAFAYDMNFEGEKLGNNLIGVGISAVNDVIGDGALKNQEIMLALAGHKPLDGLNRNVISIGIQGGFSQKSVVGPESRLWGSESDEWNRLVDGGTNAGENYQAQSFINFKFNAGAAWSYEIWEGFNMNLGYSLFNINQPKENLYSITSSDTSRLSFRNILKLGVDYHFNEVLSIHPSILVMEQSKAKNIIAGAFLGYSPTSLQDKDFTFFIGPWYRAKDAIILASAIKFQNYRLGMSYDFTSSGLNSIKEVPNIDVQSVGAFEISFTYVGFLSRSEPNSYTIPCKFF